MKKTAKTQFDMDAVLAKALTIVGNEIAKLEALSEEEEGFDYNASMRLEGYVRLALSVKKEQRTDRLEEQLESLSEEKLTALAEEAIKHIQGRNGN